MLLLQGFAMRIHSITFLLYKRARFPVIEALFMAAHISIYFGIVFSLLGMWKGIAFILVHQALFGLYMGSIFAPNHKGNARAEGQRHYGSTTAAGPHGQKCQSAPVDRLLVWRPELSN